MGHLTADEITKKVDEMWSNAAEADASKPTPQSPPRPGSASKPPLPPGTSAKDSTQAAGTRGVGGSSGLPPRRPASGQQHSAREQPSQGTIGSRPTSAGEMASTPTQTLGNAEELSLYLLSVRLDHLNEDGGSRTPSVFTRIDTPSTSRTCDMQSRPATAGAPAMSDSCVQTEVMEAFLKPPTSPMSTQTASVGTAVADVITLD